MVVSRDDRIRCSIGVTAYNEEENIGALLDALMEQHLYQVEISEIIVVASACTDRTVPLSGICPAGFTHLLDRAGRTGRQDQRHQPLPGRRRREDICVLESGDTIPHEHSVENMVRMFEDPTVGMVGAQKVAVNTPDHIAGLLSHLRLRMEHELCLSIPRLGEMIAFRKVFDHIPSDIAMDEAFVEAFVVERGMQVKYAPDAIVYNTGPSTIGDFVKQRRRNHAGHLYLKHKYGYAVSSIQNKKVLKIAFKELMGVVQLLWILFLLATLEVWSRIMGWYDFAIKRDRHVVWNMAWSQKQDVQTIRRNGQAATQNGSNGNVTGSMATTHLTAPNGK